MSDATPEVPATPAAAALADEHGVDLTQVEGSGADGKVTVADVKPVVAEAQAAADAPAADAAPADPAPADAAPAAADPAPAAPEATPEPTPPVAVAPVDAPTAPLQTPPEQFTYVPTENLATPEQHARVIEVLKAFEQSLLVWPLPIEWLVESLVAGRHLDHPPVR